MTWAFVVGEYPPQSGGVADYTRQIAERLSASGDTVHVYAPPALAESATSGVRVHRLPDRFGPRGLLELMSSLRKLPQPRRVVVQYVPQSFGMRALNFPFVLSLFTLRKLPLWVMFHEFAIVDDSRESFGKRVQAFGTRKLAALAARAAEKAFVSTPAWSPLIARAEPRHLEITWLPVPSNVPIENSSPTSARSVRASLKIANDALVIGHFGTYGMIETCRLLRAIVPALLDDAARRFLLVGRNSPQFARDLVLQYPHLESRVVVAGELTPDILAAHLEACDVLVQPYADGVTTRRGSLIAGLALGIPTVSTSGERTEDFWQSSDALLLTKCDVASIVDATERLLGDPAARARLAGNARELYRTRFDVRHTVTALREANAPRGPVRT